MTITTPPTGEITLTHAATSTDSNYNAISIDLVTATVTDDDPTTVTFTGPSTGMTATVATLTLTATVDGTSDAGETFDIGLGTLDSTGLNSGATGTDNLTGFTIREQAAIVLPPSLTINEGSSANYTVTLATLPTADVMVTISSRDTTSLTSNPTELTFTTTDWNTAQTVTLTAGADADTTDDTVTLTHTTAGDGYSATARVTVQITDNDTAPDDAVETASMQAAQQLWLPRFGLMAMEHLLDGLDYRFSVTDQSGLSGRLNGLPGGQSWNAGGERFGVGSADRPLHRSHTLSLRDMLHGSRGVHNTPGGLSVWGQASHSRYEDEQNGTAVEGKVNTGTLGVDRDNGRTLLGIALSYSDGEGDWNDAARAGKLSSTLTSLLPYVRHHMTPRLQVWATAGYGQGELQQTSATRRTKQDMEQMSAAGGVRGTLLERPVEEGGLKLALTSDVVLARIEAQGDAGLPDTTANTKRLRLGLEWSWQRPQADGGRMVPELELGLRYDSGDSQDGYGLELGGGISREWPAHDLTLDVRARGLLEHEAEQRREWGISGSLRYDTQPGSNHGLSLSLNQEYGNAPATGGLQRLLSGSLSDTLEQDTSTPRRPVARHSLKGEWGIALQDGDTGIGYAGLSSSAAARDLTLGWRWLSAPHSLNTELDIQALRREEEEGHTHHSIGAEWKLRW